MTEEIAFQTTPHIALEQIRQAVAAEVAGGAVLADVAYGNDAKFREGITTLGLFYVVGVQSSVTVWKLGTEPLPPRPWTGQGRPPKLQRPDEQHKPPSAWKNILGAKERNAACNPALPLYGCALLTATIGKQNLVPKNGCSWNGRKGNPNPPGTGYRPCRRRPRLKALVKMAKHRWVIERDYERDSSKGWVWDIMKAEVGAGFTITPPSASRPMGSWWPNAAVFPLSLRRKS